jgi:hypothetical protein
MSTPLSPMPQLNRRVFEILLRELGEAETMRFLSQLNRGSGNYTEERRELFDKLSLDEIREGIRNLHTADLDESAS